jgi:hypothetical protein
VPRQALIGGDEASMVQVRKSEYDTADSKSTDDELFFLERDLGLEKGAALPLAVLSGLAPECGGPRRDLPFESSTSRRGTPASEQS